MVSLEWSGKKAVVNHHLEVRYRLLRREPALSAENADTGNLLIQGDNR